MFLALKEKLFGNRNNASKSLARSRLHFVLVQDRTGLTGDEMSDFKKEMIAVVEKYFVIDKSGFDIAYKRDQETTTLLINSPVVVRRRVDVSQAAVGGKSGTKEVRLKNKITKSKNESNDVSANDLKGEDLPVEGKGKAGSEQVSKEQDSKEQSESPMVAQT